MFDQEDYIRRLIRIKENTPMSIYDLTIKSTLAGKTLDGMLKNPKINLRAKTLRKLKEFVDKYEKQ